MALENGNTNNSLSGYLYSFFLILFSFIVIFEQMKQIIK